MSDIILPLSEIKDVVFQKSENEVIYPMAVNFANVAKWAKAFTLTVPALPYGVKSCKIERYSVFSSESTVGDLLVLGDEPQTATVYYTDCIRAKAEPLHGFEKPSTALGGNVVLGDKELVVRPGSSNYLIPPSKTELPLTVYSSANFSCNYIYEQTITCSWEECDGCYCTNGLACGESYTNYLDLPSGLKYATALKVNLSGGSLVGFNNYDDCGCDGCYCSDGSACHDIFTGEVSASILPQEIIYIVGDPAVPLAYEGDVKTPPTLRAEVSEENVTFFLEGEAAGTYNKSKSAVISKIEYLNF